MRKIILLLSFIISFQFLFSQNSNFTVKTQTEAHYPKGDNALFEYINANLKFREAAVQKKVSGTVTISFDVLPDSVLNDFKVLKGLGYGIDSDIILLLKKLKFAPAIANNTIIKSSLILDFKITAIEPKELLIEKQ